MEVGGKSIIDYLRPGQPVRCYTKSSPLSWPTAKRREASGGAGNRGTTPPVGLNAKAAAAELLQADPGAATNQAANKRIRDSGRAQLAEGGAQQKAADAAAAPPGPWSLDACPATNLAVSSRAQLGDRRLSADNERPGQPPSDNPPPAAGQSRRLRLRPAPSHEAVVAPVSNSKQEEQREGHQDSARSPVTDRKRIAKRRELGLHFNAAIIGGSRVQAANCGARGGCGRRLGFRRGAETPQTPAKLTQSRAAATNPISDRPADAVAAALNNWQRQMAENNGSVDAVAAAGGGYAASRSLRSNSHTLPTRRHQTASCAVLASDGDSIAGGHRGGGAAVLRHQLAHGADAAHLPPPQQLQAQQLPPSALAPTRKKKKAKGKRGGSGGSGGRQQSPSPSLPTALSSSPGQNGFSSSTAPLQPLATGYQRPSDLPRPSLRARGGVRSNVGIKQLRTPASLVAAGGFIPPPVGFGNASAENSPRTASPQQLGGSGGQQPIAKASVYLRQLRETPTSSRPCFAGPAGTGREAPSAAAAIGLGSQVDLMTQRDEKRERTRLDGRWRAQLTPGREAAEGPAHGGPDARASRLSDVCCCWLLLLLLLCCCCSSKRVRKGGGSSQVDLAVDNSPCCRGFWFRLAGALDAAPKHCSWTRCSEHWSGRCSEHWSGRCSEHWSEALLRAAPALDAAPSNWYADAMLRAHCSGRCSEHWSGRCSASTALDAAPSTGTGLDAAPSTGSGPARALVWTAAPSTGLDAAPSLVWTALARALVWLTLAPSTGLDAARALVWTLLRALVWTLLLRALVWMLLRALSWTLLPSTALDAALVWTLLRGTGLGAARAGLDARSEALDVVWIWTLAARKHFLALTAPSESALNSLLVLGILLGNGRSGLFTAGACLKILHCQRQHCDK
uniref:Protein kinase domain-containing protein n=1 Tax=Macrostomum lignano TaxID=282301 RepID=A0A1I8FBF9_9PLAT